MKKCILLLGLYMIISSFLGYSIYKNSGAYSEAPLSNYFEFENIYRVAMDSNENMYIIDKSKKRISKTDPNGNVVFVSSEEELFSNSIYFYTDMTLDDAGNIYVLKATVEPKGNYVDKEEIIKYRSSNRYKPQLLYKKEYDSKQKPVRPGNIKAVRFNTKGLLCFYTIQDDGVSLKKIRNDGTSEGEDTFIKINSTDLYEIRGNEPGNIFYSTKKGEVYRVMSDLSSTKVYPLSGNSSSENSLPEFLGIDSAEHLYIGDTYSRSVSRMDFNETVEIENLLTPEVLRKTFPKIENPILRLMSVNLKGYVTTVISDVNKEKYRNPIVKDEIIVISPDGNIKMLETKVKYKSNVLLLKCLIWVQPVILIILLIFIFKLVYSNILHRRISIILKQLAVFIPVMIFGMVLIAGSVYIDYSRRYDDEVENRLKILVNIGAKSLDITSFKSVTKPADFMGYDYNKVLEGIRAIISLNTRSDEGLYTALYKVVENDGDKSIYTLMYDDNTISPMTPYDDAGKEYYDVLYSSEGTNNAICVSMSDAYGDWMYALSPIRDKDGAVIGVYEIGMDLNGFKLQERRMFTGAAGWLGAVAAVAILVFFLLTYKLLRPFRILKDAVMQMAAGNLNESLSVKTGDEGEDLCNGFNTMSQNMRDRILKITLMREAYSRFIPRQFKRYLEREEITDIVLGDQAIYEMSVMFLNIRAFYSLTDKMSSEESFNFINSFLKDIGPIIPEYGGFINKYLGIGTMALFPGDPQNAVSAALKIREKLYEYNSERQKSGCKSIELGIAIHRCKLMLGIIGEEKRLEAAVISEGVNLAQMLLNTAQKLSAYIIVTSEIIKSFEGNLSIKYRKIGMAKLEGRDEPAEVYDVFQNDPEHLSRLKENTKQLFEEGVELYEKAAFQEARRKFVEVIKQNNSDEAAKIYFFLCDKYVQKGTPNNWNANIPG